jgi:hypothetical protein
MEYLEGESLGKKIARGPMTPNECVPIVVEAMRGVAAAHRLDIIHRDLKPDNIFVCDGAERAGLTVKVLDFGVMKPMNARAEALPTITARGMAVGTPPYMAPEQVLALDSIDHRVDIYAFGVILYEALTGRLPFADATGLVLLERIVRGGAPALSKFVAGVPIGLEATVMRALSRDPRRRFQQLADFAACLRPWAAGAGEFGSMAPALRRHPRGALADTAEGSFLALHPPASPTAPEERRVIEAVVLDSHATTPQPSAAEQPLQLESDGREELPIEAALRRALARESRLPQRHAWNTPDAGASVEESSEPANIAERGSILGTGADPSAAAAAWEDAFTRGARGEPEPAPRALPPSHKDDAPRSRVPTLPLRLQDIDALRARFESERAARAKVEREEQEEEAAAAATTTELAAPRRSATSMYDLSPWPLEPVRDSWSAPTEMAVPAPRMPPMRNRTGWALVGVATALVAGIAGLQWWDEEQFDETEQSTSAASDIFTNPGPALAVDQFEALSNPQLTAANPPAETLTPAAGAPAGIEMPSAAPRNEAPYEEAPAPAVSAAPSEVEPGEGAELAASEPAEVAAVAPEFEREIPVNEAPAAQSLWPSPEASNTQVRPESANALPAHATPVSDPVVENAMPARTAAATPLAPASASSAAPAELASSTPARAEAGRTSGITASEPAPANLASAQASAADVASARPTAVAAPAMNDSTSHSVASAAISGAPDPANPSSATGAAPAAPAQPQAGPDTAQATASSTATGSSAARAANASAATPTSASTATRAATSGGARGTTATLSTAPTGASTPPIASIEVLPASQPVAARAPSPAPQRDVVLLAASPTPEAPPAPPATSGATHAVEPLGPTEYTFAGPAPLVSSSPAQDTPRPVATATPAPVAAPATPSPAPRVAANPLPNTRAQNANTRPTTPAPDKPIVLRAPGARVTITKLDVSPPSPPASANAAAVDVPSGSAAKSGNAKPAPAQAPRKTSGVSMKDF